MASALHRLAANFRDVIIKAAGLRLSDVGSRDTTDYAELICGDGVPAGAYGRATGATMVYYQKDAADAQSAVWTTCDGGTTWVRNGTTSPERFTLRWVAGQRGKPSLNAVIALDENSNAAAHLAANIADPDFEILGTNAVTSCAAIATGGGVTLTTTATSGDQVILLPHLDAGQSAWSTVLWPTSKSLIWEGSFITPATITSMILWMGLKLTNTPVAATDDDQVFLRYEAGVNGGEFQVVSSIAGVDTTTDTNIVVAASTRYRVLIVMNSSRVAKVYVNGTLVLTTTALTSTNLIPYMGVETATAGARAFTPLYEEISRLY